jgi:hypothetical protein
MQIDTEPTSLPREEELDSRDSAAKLILLGVATAILAALVLFHVEGVNGTPGFLWLYRRVPWLSIYPGMLLAAVPFLVAQILLATSKRSLVGKAIACMMLSTFAMEVIVARFVLKPYELNNVTQIVRDPIATSYFTDAELVAASPPVSQWLASYDRVLNRFRLHSTEKPPGPVLYYVMFLNLLGPGEEGFAALLGGLTIAALATLSIPAMYWFARTLTGDSRAAITAAGFFSLCPCLIVFYPMFDQIYPALACLMLGFWVLAMRDNRLLASTAFGCVLALLLFWSYVQLVLGAFVVLYALDQIAQHGKVAIRRFLIHSANGLGVVLMIYSILHFATGFNPIATFRMALENQKHLLANLIFPRPYPQGIPADFQDFALGSGWISVPLLIFWILRRNREDPPVRRVIWVGLFQILIVGLTGLIPGESARVWMFMQPLLLVPIGLELSRWNRWHGGAVFVFLWILTVVMAQNMIFVGVGSN